MRANISRGSTTFFVLTKRNTKINQKDKKKNPVAYSTSTVHAFYLNWTFGGCMIW